MARFLLQRFLLGLLTLWVLSLVVFLLAQVLPGDVARRVLGPLASPEAVAALNHELGTDRSLVVQYADWIAGVVRGDLGESLAFRQPVADVVGPALVNSAKLGALAFVLVVPLGIAGGVIAARNRGRWKDRVITVGGITATVIPEFVWAIMLILVFSVSLGLLPSTAEAGDGAGIASELEHLLLPAVCLVLVLFGYIARMARAGTIEALRADYTRTAVIKGLPERLVLRRYVLPNALLPTIAVAATQAGYLAGGLVVIETIFNYQGIGLALFKAAQQKDFPMLQSTVMVVGAVYLIATLVADVLYSLLDPRVRLATER